MKSHQKGAIDMPSKEERMAVNVKLPISFLEKLQTLAEAWNLETRGEALEKLLEQIFNEEEEHDT